MLTELSVFSSEYVESLNTTNLTWSHGFDHSNCFMLGYTVNPYIIRGYNSYAYNTIELKELTNDASLWIYWNQFQFLKPTC